MLISVVFTVLEEIPSLARANHHLAGPQATYCVLAPYLACYILLVTKPLMSTNELYVSCINHGRAEITMDQDHAVCGWA